MSEQQKEESMEEILKKFAETPWEQTYAANQGSFEPFTHTLRYTVKTELHETIPEFGTLPFDTVNTILVIVGFGAPREGARVFSSFTGPFSSGALQVDSDELLDAVVNSNNPMAEENELLLENMEKYPELNDVLVVTGEDLLGRLTKLDPILSDHEDTIRRMLFANLFTGVRLELLYPVLAARKAEEGEYIASLLPDKTGHAHERVLERIKKKYKKADKINPWPKNRLCICGEDLNEHLVCCSKEKPLDPHLFGNDLKEDFLLKTPCCKANLTGFRCEKCGRFYTWTRGLVDSY